MTYAGNGSRPTNRVLIALVIITILVVAVWAMSGGLDEVQATETDTVVVSD